MARPRTFDEDEVLQAAKAAFWGRGYERTGLRDLEEATGLSRSSLYLVFGSKRALFEAVLADYEDRRIVPLLLPVEAEGAGLAEAAGFFAGLGALFEQPAAGRGCLVMNAVAELGDGDEHVAGIGARLGDRYRSAFAHALGSVMERSDAARRSRLLAASVMGLWLAVRTDPAAAARDCRAISNEIRSWGRPG